VCVGCFFAGLMSYAALVSLQLFSHFGVTTFSLILITAGLLLFAAVIALKIDTYRFVHQLVQKRKERGRVA
jgi:hypothetical protein